MLEAVFNNGEEILDLQEYKRQRELEHEQGLRMQLRYMCPKCDNMAPVKTKEVQTQTKWGYTKHGKVKKLPSKDLVPRNMTTGAYMLMHREVEVPGKAEWKASLTDDEICVASDRKRQTKGSSAATSTKSAARPGKAPTKQTSA